MLGLGMAEVMVLLVVGLLLFGNQLPNMARWLGKSIAEFQREANNLTSDLKGPSNPLH